MRYLTTNSLFTPTKAQLEKAKWKVMKAHEAIKPVRDRVDSTEVKVKKWFGLRKVTMTQEAHILQRQEKTFLAFSLIAWIYGYVTFEEYKLLDFIEDSPSYSNLFKWCEMETVYLGEHDFDELMHCLEEEIE